MAIITVVAKGKKKITKEMALEAFKPMTESELLDWQTDSLAMLHCSDMQEISKSERRHV